MSICQGKDSWPELVGLSGLEAVKVIEEENSLVTAIIVLPGQPIIGNFSCARVWVFVNIFGKVNRVPVIG
ncbi:hypothetical protein AAHA92_17164 [Salvia divinorum]|uniref:Uncharacterized protein n=1 Tax=Salvia divinorum TaxID=28513 RepID=A0ABD1GY17_SALDI